MMAERSGLSASGRYIFNVILGLGPRIQLSAREKQRDAITASPRWNVGACAPAYTFHVVDTNSSSSCAARSNLRKS